MEKRYGYDKLKPCGHFGYFRPLVAAYELATADKTTVQERIALFQAMSRVHMFLSLIVSAGFNASNKSSDYYISKGMCLRCSIGLPSITEELDCNCNN